MVAASPEWAMPKVIHDSFAGVRYSRSFCAGGDGDVAGVVESAAFFMAVSRVVSSCVMAVSGCTLLRRTK